MVTNLIALDLERLQDATTKEELLQRSDAVEIDELNQREQDVQTQTEDKPISVLVEPVAEISTVSVEPELPPKSNDVQIESKPVKPVAEVTLPVHETGRPSSPMQLEAVKEHSLEPRDETQEDVSIFDEIQSDVEDNLLDLDESTSVAYELETEFMPIEVDASSTSFESTGEQMQQREINDFTQELSEHFELLAPEEVEVTKLTIIDTIKKLREAREAYINQSEDPQEIELKLEELCTELLLSVKLEEKDKIIKKILLVVQSTELDKNALLDYMKYDREGTHEQKNGFQSRSKIAGILQQESPLLVLLGKYILQLGFARSAA